MPCDDRFEKALHSANPIDSLRALALQLSAEGYSKPQIVEFFDQLLLQFEHEPEREADADAIRDVLDFLVGWCSPHMKLLRDGNDASPAVPR